MGQAERMGYRFRGQVGYQGFDGDAFGGLARTGEMRRRLGVPADATLVAAVGRLIEVKGLHVLAEAAERILAGRPKVHVAIAGYGPMRARIEEIVARSSARDRVHLAGTLEHGEVAQLLAESDLFVNPGVVDSRGRAEGLGITTLEAMASGLAVVGSRVGGIPETMVDGVTGLLVPPGDVGALAGAVGRLLDDEAMRRRMGEAGRAFAREICVGGVGGGGVGRLSGGVGSATRQAVGRANGRSNGREGEASSEPIARPVLNLGSHGGSPSLVDA